MSLVYAIMKTMKELGGQTSQEELIRAMNAKGMGLELLLEQMADKGLIGCAQDESGECWITLEGEMYMKREELRVQKECLRKAKKERRIILSSVIVSAVTTIAIRVLLHLLKGRWG